MVEKYCAHIGVSVEAYKTLLKKEPSESLLKNDLFANYIAVLDVYSEKGRINTKGLCDAAKKIRTDIRNRVSKKTFNMLSEQEKKEIIAKTTIDFISEIEKEKLYYFMLLSKNHQPVVCVKSPEKSSIKKFLGYEWSDTKGNEGIKYINVQIKKSDDDGEQIDDTIEQIKGIDGIKTPLFNPKDFNDSTKINTIIRANFEGKTVTIPESLSEYVKTIRLVDMIDFSRTTFDKAIKTSVAKKVEFESKYQIMNLNQVADIEYGTRITKHAVTGDSYPVYGGGGETFRNGEFNREDRFVISRFGMSPECVRFVRGKFFLNDSGLTVKSTNDLLNTKFLDFFLYSMQQQIYDLGRGSAQKNLDMDSFGTIKIPLPPLDVQKSIVAECEAVDSEYQNAQKEIAESKNEIAEIMASVHNSDAPVMELSNVITNTEYGTAKKSEKQGKAPVIRMGNIQDGHIDMSDLVYSNDESDIEKLALKKYDVLFNRTNSPEHVGKVGIYLSDEPAIFAGYLIRINYNPDKINPVYLCNVLNSKKIREYGFSIMSKSINQANISGSALTKYPIPVPPIAEQQKIVAQISTLEEKITAAKRVMSECPEKKQAILDKWLR